LMSYHNTKWHHNPKELVSLPPWKLKCHISTALLYGGH